MDIISRVKALNLPADKYVVFGSGVLEAHGIRKAKDVDVVVNNELYKELKRRGWKRHWFFWRVLTCKALKNGGNEAFSNLKVSRNYHFETDELLKRAEVIDGVPFLPLKDLLIIKREFSRKRKKDSSDVKLIEEYLAQ